MNWKGVACALASMLAMGPRGWADDGCGYGAASPSVVLQPVAWPILADQAAPTTDITELPPEEPPQAVELSSTTPFMYDLNETATGKWLSDHGFNFTGYFEGGYFHDLNVPGNIAGKRTFAGDHVSYPGAYKDQVILDQADFALSRTIDASKGFDVGFMVEGNYGRDSFFNHSNGILDDNNKHGGEPDDQFDLLQAYLTVGIPLGSGLTITAGKFNALMGYEANNPTSNALYTHSYAYTYGTPLTYTGVTATYNITSALSAQAGISRGWNESSGDNNGAIDGIYQLIWKPSSELTITADGSVGPEGVPGTIPYGPRDNSDYWFVPEIYAVYQPTADWKLALVGEYGFANHFSQWYAGGGYASYTINKYFTLNGRGEWYSDGGGLTTGVAGTTNYAEATLGVQIKLFPNDQIFQFFQIRPEIREDVADRSVFDGRDNQFTVAVDVIMQF